MDQAVLVKNDKVIGAKIIDVLSRAAIPITLWDWVFIPQLEEWQLVVASPWVDSKGPRNTYRAVVDALQKANIYQQAPMRRVFLRSPDDPFIRELDRDIKEKNEGFIHILKDLAHHRYSVIFAPVAQPGGAVPHKDFPELSDLKNFLSEDLRVRSIAINEALREMDYSEAASIYPVTLSTRQIKKLGLN